MDFRDSKKENQFFFRIYHGGEVKREVDRGVDRGVDSAVKEADKECGGC